MQRSTGMEQLRPQHQQAQLQLQYQCHPQMQFPPTTYRPDNTILKRPIHPNHPSQNCVYHQQQQQQQQQIYYQHQQMGSKPIATQSVQRQGIKRKRQDIGQVTTMTKVVTSIPPANGKTSGNRNGQSKPSPNKTSGSLLVELGSPTDTLGEGLEWPKGWTKIKKQRLGGASAGSFDCYWISPILKHRLRSLPEVRKFLRALQANGGDELLAKQILKIKKPKQEKTEPSKNKKPALKEATKEDGKSSKAMVQRRPGPSLQTPPSSAIGGSAKKPSLVAQKSPHSVAVTKSRAKGVPIAATQTSQNIQTIMKVDPLPTSQPAVAVAAESSELMTKETVGKERNLVPKLKLSRRTEDPSIPVLLKGLRLAHPKDPEHVNTLHCFVRSKLLEVYVLKGQTIASKKDTMDNETSHEEPPNLVGIRCAFCGPLPKSQRGTGQTMAVFFPKSIGEIYQGVCTWQRIHFPACQHMPENYRREYKTRKEMDRSRGKKVHWIKSAYDLGLRNIDSMRSGLTYRPDAPYDTKEVLKIDMATSTAPTKKQQKDSQEQSDGQLSQQQQQKQNQVPSPDALEVSPESPLSGQNLGSSIVSGDSDEFGGKIGFAEYHIEL